jgi:hypothetical protein
MTALEKIAFYQGRRDEVPNQELARQLVESSDHAGLQEIAGHLSDSNPNVQSDCLKVLYEVGYLKPALIADYCGDFLKLIRSKNNRLVWGAMIALATIAPLCADELYPHVAELEHAMDVGSVITRDNGVKILAAIAAASPGYNQTIFPFLLHHLQTCRPKDVPQHSEAILQAVDAVNWEAFVGVLEKRMEDLSGAQPGRVNKVIRAAQQKRHNQQGLY